MAGNEAQPDDLSGVVAAGMERLSEDLHVSMPGRIEEYDKKTRLALVQPLIKRRYYAKDEPVMLPTIKNVPIRQQRTKLAQVYIPPQVGDYVELIFSDRSIENWIAGNGEPREPLDLRKHHMSDAWAILDGGTPTSELAVSNPDNVVIKHGSCEIHIEKDGFIQLGSESAADFVALAQKVLDELNDIRSQFDSHTHLYSPGPGTPTASATPTSPMGPAQPVNADKTRAD